MNINEVPTTLRVGSQYFCLRRVATGSQCKKNPYCLLALLLAKQFCLMVSPLCHNEELNEQLHGIGIQGLIDEYLFYKFKERTRK